MKYITSAKRLDGFGAQVQNIINTILYAELHGYTYVYNPITSMEHNIYNDKEFLNIAEDTMNLKDYYAGDVKTAEVVDTNIYEEVERNIDRLCESESMRKIKELYWENKPVDHFKNQRFNIAVHIRRYNSVDRRPDGTDTPDDYYLYLIKRLREKYADKDPLFHIYSQGIPDIQFYMYKSHDTVFHINEDMFDTFNAFVAADVLVTSASSFSYVAGLLSDGDVYYHVFWHKPKKSWQILYDFEKKKREKLKVPLLMCTMKIALSCDYIICPRFSDTHEVVDWVIDDDALRRLKDGNKLFINGTKIEEFVDHVISCLPEGIKLQIIISNVEPHCDEGSIRKLLPHAYNIYVANNTIDHPQIHVIPIGLRDPVQVHSTHQNFTHDLIRNKMKENFNKEHLCLMCFRLDESSSDNRKECTRVFEKKKWVTNINDRDFGRPNSVKQCGKVPIDIHYEYIGKSKYALCPTGYGYDVHKFYECLYLKCVPIVVKTSTPFDRLYDVFPCLKLNSWDELTEEMLHEKYQEKYDEIIHFETNTLLKIL